MPNQIVGDIVKSRLKQNIWISNISVWVAQISHGRLKQNKKVVKLFQTIGQWLVSISVAILFYILNLGDCGSLFMFLSR